MEPNINNPISTNEIATDSKKKVGPIVVILAVVLILIIGALYLFSSSVTKTPSIEEQANVVETVQPVTNTSDDVQTLDADLNASIEGLDQTNF